MRIINQGAEDVAVSAIKPHPKNPNEGDTGAIHESVDTNGFYGRVIANRRTGHIVAGNHRYLAAVQAGATTVPVEWIDVDAETELRILLADNRTTRRGFDNPVGLADLLSGLAATPIGLTGTGFDAEDLDRLIGELSDTEAPEDFKTYSDDLPTDFCCPKCGYRWSGKPS